MQKSFKPTTQQRAEMDQDEPANNGSAAIHEAAADLLRQEGFSADVPEQEEQVMERMKWFTYQCCHLVVLSYNHFVSGIHLL